MMKEMETLRVMTLTEQLLVAIAHVVGGVKEKDEVPDLVCRIRKRPDSRKIMRGTYWQPYVLLKFVRES
jgi:hypothetical protein